MCSGPVGLGAILTRGADIPASLAGMTGVHALSGYARTGPPRVISGRARGGTATRPLRRAGRGRARPVEGRASRVRGARRGSANRVIPSGRGSSRVFRGAGRGPRGRRARSEERRGGGEGGGR